jgi:hypothetical protein
MQNQQKIEFVVVSDQLTSLKAYFWGKGYASKGVGLYGGEEIEFFVGDNPIPESVSGTVGLRIKENEDARAGFSLKYTGNLVREETSEIYAIVDTIKKRLEAAANKGIPIMIDITDDLASTGWDFALDEEFPVEKMPNYFIEKKRR